MRVAGRDLAHTLFGSAATAAAEQLAPLRGAAVHVSGASGFLAANLLALIQVANERADLGLRLFASARRPASEVPLFRYLGIAPEFDWEIAPVETSTLPNVADLVVVHAASFGAPSDYMREPLATFRANTEGLVSLFGQAADVGASHVVYLSSAEVYGQPDEDSIPTPESHHGAPDLASPRSVYGESKRMAEVLGAVLAERHGIPFTAFRPWNVYGPGQRLDDGRVPMAFMVEALTQGQVLLASDGTPRRCPASAWDALLQLISCLPGPAQGSRAFNLGDPSVELTMLDLARRCAATAGLPASAVSCDPAARTGGLRRCVPDVNAVVRRARPPLPAMLPLDAGLTVLREWVNWSLRDDRA